MLQYQYLKQTSLWFQDNVNILHKDNTSIWCDDGCVDQLLLMLKITTLQMM